ncbi:hypothetical protein DSECCO2_640210 [anaerobic digester metagenome]
MEVLKTTGAVNSASWALMEKLSQCTYLSILGLLYWVRILARTVLAVEGILKEKSDQAWVFKSRGIQLFHWLPLSYSRQIWSWSVAGFSFLL